VNILNKPNSNLFNRYLLLILFILILFISSLVSISLSGTVQSEEAPSVIKVVMPASVAYGESFTATITATSKIGIDYVGFQYEGRTVRRGANGQKNVTLSVQFKATKLGLQHLRIIAVDKNRTQSKSVTKTINVMARIKEKEVYTVKPDDPPKKVEPQKFEIDTSAIVYVSSLSIEPKPIFADQPSTATVTLNNPAPRGGLDLVVEVKSPEGRHAAGFGSPFRIQVPAEEKQSTFQLRTSKELPQRAHVSVIHGNRRVTEEVDVVWPPKISQLIIEPLIVHAGEEAKATVKLWDAALKEGTEVILSTDHPEAVSLPSRIVIPEGEKDGTFDFRISREAPGYITIKTKTSALSSKQIKLPVNPPVIISSVSVEPKPVIVDQAATATVRLKEPAPEGDLNLKVEFTTKAGSIANTFGPQFNIKIPAGETRGSFNLLASTAHPGGVVVNVVQGGYRVTEEVPVVWPPAIESFVIVPQPAVKGETAQATITLRAPALQGGAVVKLVPRESEAMNIPAEIRISEGERTGNFEIQISREAPNSISIEAQASSISKMWASVSLNAPKFISSVSVDQKKILIDQLAYATAVLKEPAPEGGLDLTAQIRDRQGSRHRSFVVQGALHIPAGETTKSFSFRLLDGRKPAALCGTFAVVTVYQGGHVVTEEVEIICPPEIESFTLERAPAVKGETVEATLTLSEPALSGGTKVDLILLTSGHVTIPSEITIPEGEKTGSFDIRLGLEAPSYFEIEAKTSSISSKKETFQSVPPLTVQSFSVEDLPIMVDETSTATVDFAGPATAQGFEFEVFVKTKDGKSAWGFDGPRFSVSVPAGVFQTSFPLKTDREYPGGAVVHLLYKGMAIARKDVAVAPQMKIESIVVDPPRILAGRSALATITLNRLALPGETHVVTLSVSGPAGQAVELPENVTIPVTQTKGSFMVKVGSSAENFFAIKAEIPSHSLTVTIHVDKNH